MIHITKEQHSWCALYFCSETNKVTESFDVFHTCSRAIALCATSDRPHFSGGSNSQVHLPKEDTHKESASCKPCKLRPGGGPGDRG